MEVSPGIHRIESDLGPRFMCQFLLIGDERSLLVDTGLADTPDAVIVPYLESIGMTGDGLSLVLISHADVDHCGGNRAFQRRFGGVPFAAHHADRPWIASNAAMMDGNYLWYRDYGFGPDEDVAAWIREQLGGRLPRRRHRRRRRDAAARRRPLGRGAAPAGHTAGHVGLWDAEHRVALIVDAVLERGVRDRAGTLLIPPRIYDVAGYRTSIARLRALEPELLLTAHFPVMRGVEVDAFLAARWRSWTRSRRPSPRPAPGGSPSCGTSPATSTRGSGRTRSS
jgi:glyoxylase-like metal-dependent hydrolase (beta-lactamase superfamily II)